MRYLVRILKYWEEDESSEIRKIENCIKKYNSILLEKEQYEKLKNK